MSFDQPEKVSGNDDGRARAIRAAAAIALKELELLRSAGPMTNEAFDAAVERIGQELRGHGCDLVVHREGHGRAGVTIEFRDGEVTYDLIKTFFHRDNAQA